MPGPLVRCKTGRVSSIDETFVPAGVQWQQVSRKLATVGRLRITFGLVLVAILVVIGLLIPPLPDWIPLVVAVAGIIGFIWAWWFIGRRQKSWAYSEREDDLLVTRGFMFRRLVIVPYGRMQLVDVAAGPLERYFGIAKLQLHTAAATTDAVIPGLTPDIAAALRDRLAELGEQRAAGL